MEQLRDILYEFAGSRVYIIFNMNMINSEG